MAWKKPCSVNTPQDDSSQIPLQAMMDCPGVRFHTSPAFRGELTRIIGVTFAGTVPNADKTVPNQKCWDLCAGQQGGVIVAMSLRGLSWLGQSGLLAGARAWCCDKGWWHQLGKSSVDMETQLKPHLESWRAQEFRRKGHQPLILKISPSSSLGRPTGCCHARWGDILCCYMVLCHCM